MRMNMAAVLLAGVMVFTPCMTADAAYWDDDDDWDDYYEDDTPFWESLEDWEIEAAAISGPGLEAVDNPTSYVYSFDYDYLYTGDGWQQLGTGDWVYWENGALVANAWRLIDNIWYYFDENGIMKLGITADGTITDGTTSTYDGPSGGFVGETVYLDGIAQANKTSDTTEQKQTSFSYDYDDRNTHTYSYDDWDHSDSWWYEDDDDDDWDDDDWDDDDD